MKEKLTLLLAILVVGYLLLVFGLYWFQTQIVFQRKTLEKDYKYEFDEPFTEVEVESSSGTFINTLIFKPPIAEPKGTLLYFHGNADNMQRWGNYAADFTKIGYQVVMIDYTGFGKTQGTPTEELLYQNAEDIWKWSQHHLPTNNFIIYGRSLGTAVASHLAVNHSASHLILETPFYQLKQDRLKYFFPFGLKYEFANYKNIPLINYPITIIQGTNDWVVSIKSANRLKPLLKTTDNFFIIKGGGHKNLRNFEEYHQLLKDVL